MDKEKLVKQQQQDKKKLEKELKIDMIHGSAAFNVFCVELTEVINKITSLKNADETKAELSQIVSKLNDAVKDLSPAVQLAINTAATKSILTVPTNIQVQMKVPVKIYGACAKICVAGQEVITMLCERQLDLVTKVEATGYGDFPIDEFLFKNMILVSSSVKAK